MDTAELLQAAQLVMDEAPRSLGADRTLPAALLVRQALEAAVDGLWATTVPAMAALSDRAQQITLPFYADPSLARDVSWAWAQLSMICHHHAYALAPTASELAHLIAVVERALAAAAERPQSTASA